jgi:dihydroxyacetone kinase phosphotransfer subunit
VVVGLVVVAHSDLLARGVAELAAQMGPEVPIGAAGGTDDGGIGTSLELVSSAIAEADRGGGAVVLFDLGSAQMTAEMAVELLDPEQQQRVVLVDAPLVEGAIAAVTEAAAGHTLDAVGAAARAAAAIWQAPAVAATTGPSMAAVVPLEAGAVEATVTMRNPLGLHARPAVALARAVRDLDAELRVERADTGAAASGRSVLELVGLAASGGTTLRLVARGPDAGEALRRAEDLAQAGFGELPENH